MSNRFVLWTGWLIVSAGWSWAAQDPDVIKIGMVDSLVKDLSPGKQKLIDADFPDMVKEYTGLASKVFQGGDPLSAGQKFVDGQWHLGVFQGVEFAWAQAKDPKLQPLMVAVGREKSIHALLVAKKEGAVASFADLNGRNVKVLQGREHCRLFADKGAGGDAKKHFGKVVATSNAEITLDEILLGKIDAAIVDNAAFENYNDIQPGRFKRMKVLAQSEPFPASVIAYRQGGLSDGVLEKFKTGMLKANDSARGRDLMANFNITAFAAPPADYAKQLGEILKAYPGSGK